MEPHRNKRARTDTKTESEITNGECTDAQEQESAEQVFKNVSKAEAPPIHPFFQRSAGRAKSTTLHLIRHGESSGYNLFEDVELTRTGQEQARALQQKLLELRADVVLVRYSFGCC